MHPALRLLGLLLVAAHALPAQTPDPATTGRQFHLAAVGVQSRDIRYLSPQTNRPYYLDVRPGHIAGPYALGSTTLPLFKLAPDGTRTPAALARIPDSIRSPLVVLVPGPAPGPGDTTLTYATLVLDYSEEQAPANSIRFLNVSPLPVAVAFGKTTPSVLPPGGQTIARFTPPPPDDCYVPLKLAFTRDGTQWTRIPVGHPDDDIALGENLRITIILNPDPAKPDGGGPSAFTTITTHLPPTPTP